MKKEKNKQKTGKRNLASGMTNGTTTYGFFLISEYKGERTNKRQLIRLDHGRDH